jgi:hypothetical protein
MFKYRHVNIIQDVYAMSEEKRSPVSIYLTPRAAMILREYNIGSAYGSLSRTVEEIILAFDMVYENIKSFKQISQIAPTDPQKQKEQAAVYLVSMISLLQTISSSISRLQKP